MKLCIVLFVVLVTFVWADDNPIVKGVVKKCLAESGLSKKELDKAVLDENPNEKLDCFTACLLREQKMLNQDGTVNKEVVSATVAYLASEETGKKKAEIFQKCFVDPKKKLSFCLAGGTISRCIHKMYAASAK